MNLLFGFLGVLLLAGVIFGWYYLHHRLSGEGGPLFSSRKRDSGRDEATNLEAFIAAYRAGKVPPEQLKSGTTATAVPASPQAAPATPAAVAQQPVFLRPEVKLAYLTFRAGLRDHHVFPNVRLSDLGRGAANGKVDVLVCDAGFRFIAAVDVLAAEARPEAEKLSFLRDAGIRYLKVTVGTMPKPAEARALVYRA
jgi:hypothetical protein